MQPGEEVTKMIGSPMYMAPEVVMRESYDNKVDIWALGVITTELLTGHPPFNATTKQELFYNVVSKHPNISGGPKDMV